MVMARNGSERWSAISTRGNRYSCTANQFPNVTTTAEAPVEPRVQSSAASANMQEANVSAVSRDRTRSEGTQPINQNRANRANTAPGAITANTSEVCGRLTLPDLPAQSESTPWVDVRFCPSTIRRKKGLRAAVPGDRQTLRILSP